MPYRDGHAQHDALGLKESPPERPDTLADDIKGLMASHELMLRLDRKESEDYKEGVKAAHDQIRRLIDRYERGDSNE